VERLGVEHARLPRGSTRDRIISDRDQGRRDPLNARGFTILPQLASLAPRRGDRNVAIRRKEPTELGEAVTFVAVVVGGIAPARGVLEQRLEIGLCLFRESGAAGRNPDTDTTRAPQS
jgi:hypothetical protein